MLIHFDGCKREEDEASPGEDDESEKDKVEPVFTKVQLARKRISKESPMEKVTDIPANKTKERDKRATFAEKSKEKDQPTRNVPVQVSRAKLCLF